MLIQGYMYFIVLHSNHSIDVVLHSLDVLINDADNVSISQLSYKLLAGSIVNTVTVQYAESSHSVFCISADLHHCPCSC